MTNEPADRDVDHYATIQERDGELESWTCSCGVGGTDRESLVAHFDALGLPLEHEHHHRVIELGEAE